MALNYNKKEGDQLHAEEWNELVQEVQGKQPRINVVDSLDSNSSVDVLSAKQGKVLNDRLSNTITNVNNVANVVKTLPVGYFYGTYTTEEELQEVTTTEKGYAYVGTGNPYIIYTFDADLGWTATENKYSTPTLETDLSTGSEVKAPTTKAVKEGIESVDVTTQQEFTSTQKKTARTNIGAQENIPAMQDKFPVVAALNDRVADVVPVTNEVKALGYKVLDPSLSFAEQVTESNTTYEIRNEFNLDSKVEGTIDLDTTASFAFGTGNVSYSISTQTLTLAPNQYIEVPAFAHVVDVDKTTLHPNLWRNASQEVVSVYVASILGSATLPYTIHNVVSIPANCELKFNGGRLVGGRLDLNGASLTGDIKLHSNPAQNIEDETDETYKPSNNYLHVSWFGAVGDGVVDDSDALRRVVAWTHKKGTTIEFGKGLTYIMGDGIADNENDPLKIKHTGYTYDGEYIFKGDQWSSFSSTQKLAYIKEHPNNIGREITLVFWKFEGLTIEGNNSILLSNPNNGICRHNVPFIMCSCQDFVLNNLSINDNSFNRISTSYKYIFTDGMNYQSVFLDKITNAYNSYYSYLHRSRGVYAGNNWGELDYCADYGALNATMFFDIRNCEINSFNVTKAIRRCANFTGTSDRTKRNIVINNSEFEYSLYHVVGTAKLCGAEFNGCTIRYGGLNEDLTDCELSYNTCTTLDLESDNRDEKCLIEYLSFNHCLFGRSRSDKNRVILNIDAQHITFHESYFDNVDLTTVPNVNGLANEVSHCIFKNSLVGFSQEGLYVHECIFNIENPSSTYKIYSKEKIYDQNYTTGFLYRYRVDILKEGYTFKRWVDGNTENPRILPLYTTANFIITYTDETTDPVTIENYTSENGKNISVNGIIVAQITLLQSIPDTIASVIPTRVINNTFKFDYSEDYNFIENHYAGLIKCKDNIIFENNTIINAYAIVGYGAFTGRVRIFRNNIYKVESEKYPNLPKFEQNILLFSGEGYIGDNKGIELNGSESYRVSDNTYLSPVTGIVVANSGKTAFDGYANVNRFGSTFPDSEQLLISGSNTGLSFFNTSTKKPNFFVDTIISTSTNKDLTSSNNIDRYDPNPLTEGNIYVFKIAQSGSSGTHIISFCKTEGSLEGAIRIELKRISQGGTGYIWESSYFKAPSVSTYPYINIRIVSSGSARKFFRYIQHGGSWIEADSLPSVPRRGTTAQRPTSELTVADAGLSYYDTDLGKPIYWNGVSWIDANGDYIFDNSGSLQNRLALTSPIKGQQFKLTRESETDVYLIYGDYGWLNAIDGTPWFDDSGTLNAMYDKYNYVLLTEEPSTWATTYNTYYKIVDGVYTKLTTLETWAEDTYYKKDVNVNKGIQIKLIDDDTELHDKVVKWNGTKYINIVDNVALKAGTPIVKFTTKNNTTTATITSTSSGKIYYTKDGSTPTSSSTEYSSAITLADRDQVKAICIRDHVDDSAIGFVKVATPVITFSSAGILTITCDTANAKIYYTTNDSTPTTSSTEYDSSASVTIAENVTVKALAVLIGRVNSGVASKKRS